MSRKHSRKKRVQIQSLEQLLLMSASGLDIDAHDVDGIPVAAENSAAEISVNVFQEESETANIGDDVASANGQPLGFPPSDELPPFLFEESDFGPTAATGMVTMQFSSEAAGEISSEPNLPPEFVVIEGPDGDLIEVPLDSNLPEFLFELEFDPAAASGVVTEDTPDRPLEGGVDELVDEQFLTADGVRPEFPPIGEDFNEIFATGLVEIGLPEEASEFEPIEFLSFDDSTTAVEPSDGPFPQLPSGVEFATSASTPLEEDSSRPVGSEPFLPAAGSGEVAETAFEDFPTAVVDLAAASGAAEDLSDGDVLTTFGQDSSSFETDGAQADGAVLGGATEDNVIFQSSAGGGIGNAVASIVGSDLAEWITGTVGDDVINAGDGDDEIHVVLGDNIVDGGAGEDTLVVYEGVQADYTIVKLASGVTTFEGPGLNGETVRIELSNVEMILFNDGVLQLDDLTPAGGVPVTASTVTGTAAGEWIVGTSQDDSIFGDDGDDEIYAPLGMNTIDGGNGFDTLVVYEGSRADFVLSRLSSGAVVLEGIGLNGETVRSEMKNVERILFNDGAILTSAV